MSIIAASNADIITLEERCLLKILMKLTPQNSVKYYVTQMIVVIGLVGVIISFRKVVGFYQRTESLKGQTLDVIKELMDQRIVLVSNKFNISSFM